MKRILKKVTVVATSTVVLAAGLTGCGREADRVSYNVSQEADNFNVIRRLVVLTHGRTNPCLSL